MAAWKANVLLHTSPFLSMPLQDHGSPRNSIDKPPPYEEHQINSEVLELLSIDPNTFDRIQVLNEERAELESQRLRTFLTFILLIDGHLDHFKHPSEPYNTTLLGNFQSVQWFHFHTLAKVLLHFETRTSTSPRLTPTEKRFLGAYLFTNFFLPAEYVGLPLEVFHQVLLYYGRHADRFGHYRGLCGTYEFDWFNRWLFKPSTCGGGCSRAEFHALQRIYLLPLVLPTCSLAIRRLLIEEGLTSRDGTKHITNCSCGECVVFRKDLERDLKKMVKQSNACHPNSHPDSFYLPISPMPCWRGMKIVMLDSDTVIGPTNLGKALLCLREVRSELDDVLENLGSHEEIREWKDDVREREYEKGRFRFWPNLNRSRSV
ncbi:hypothetical protein NA57DRAFT_60413 [Rhizodiscina lignyota]|uniref:Uncharacterized protein n=1 Tax=Rhizodiscina lignyota TaxID=1504668 RepID=A0A9P4I7Y2_9PEZI|nr:hypothetical protein NA57DRAFT_60413 [Rhizodiscina lignyota]